jgi:hypothetical protein
MPGRPTTSALPQPAGRGHEAHPLALRAGGAGEVVDVVAQHRLAPVRAQREGNIQLGPGLGLSCSRPAPGEGRQRDRPVFRDPRHPVLARRPRDRRHQAVHVQHQACRPLDGRADRRSPAAVAAHCRASAISSKSFGSSAPGTRRPRPASGRLGSKGTALVAWTGATGACGYPGIKLASMAGFPRARVLLPKLLRLVFAGFSITGGYFIPRATLFRFGLALNATRGPQAGAGCLPALF